MTFIQRTYPGRPLSDAEYIEELKTEIKTLEARIRQLEPATGTVKVWLIDEIQVRSGYSSNWEQGYLDALKAVYEKVEEGQ